MPFETPFGDAFEGTISATVHEHGGEAPRTIIQTDDSWAVNVRWRTTGVGTGMITGTWHLHVFLESIGPGADLNLIDPADHVIPLTPDDSPVDYFVHFDVPATNNPTVPLAGALYKLVVSLTYFEPTGSKLKRVFHTLSYRMVLHSR